MKRLISAFLLLAMIFSLCSCIPQRSITPTTYESEHEGVYVTIDSILGEGFDRKLVTTWHNETDTEVTFGYDYSIEYNDGGVWKHCQYRDFAVIEIACIIAPGETVEMEYATEYFNLLRSGEYRLALKCTIQLDINTADNLKPDDSDGALGGNDVLIYHPDTPLSKWHKSFELYSYFEVN